MKRVAMRSGGPASWAIRLVLAVVLVAVSIYIPTSTSNGFIDSCITALTYMAAAMSLNLLLGFTGQISIGHSAFFGIGAYTTAILVSKYGWSPFTTIPVAFLVAFAVGALVSLPALRIKGVYLALVTLALGLVFPQLVKAPKLEWLTGGARGLDKTGFRFTKKNPTYEIFGWNPWGNLRGENVKPFFFWIAMVIVIVVYLVCRGVVKSRAGRSLIAIRDNETAAAVMGVNLASTKALAFGLSAALCSLPGCLSAFRTGNVTPDSANITVLGAITFLVIMVVGGAGSLWGPIVGSVLFSAKGVVVKLHYRHQVDAMTVLALRMLFSLPFFAAVAWWQMRRRDPLSSHDRWRILLLGLIGYYLSSYLDFIGLQYVSAGIGRLILFGYTWALIHHMLGGIRHLIWDTGYGYGPTEREYLTVATLVGSKASSAVIALPAAMLAQSREEVGDQQAALSARSKFAERRREESDFATA